MSWKIYIRFEVQICVVMSPYRLILTSNSANKTTDNNDGTNNRDLVDYGSVYFKPMQ